MTDWAEIEPLIARWLYASVVAVVFISIGLIVYPYVPTSEQWSLCRYIVMGITRIAFGTIVLPGAAIVVDFITPGGSFIARVSDAKYGPAVAFASILLSVALMACWV